MIFPDHDIQIGTFIILHQKKWEIAGVHIKKLVSYILRFVDPSCTNTFSCKIGKELNCVPFVLVQIFVLIPRPIL